MIIGTEPWTGFTQSQYKCKTLTDTCGLGARLTTIQATARPDHVRPEIGSRMSKAARRKEKQQWAVEKPKLDNARKLRGTYFIDPNDKEFQETIENARKTLKIPMEAANQYRETRGGSDN